MAIRLSSPTGHMRHCIPPKKINKNKHIFWRPLTTFDDPNFFKKIFDKIPEMSDSSPIICGDYNTVLCSTLDKQPSQTSRSKGSIMLNTLIKSLNVVDIWRLLHPKLKDFSFFSPFHKSQSRIDYFLLDSRLLSNVSFCTYRNILISDHAPVSLDLKLNIDRGEYNWRLNTSLLSDPEFRDILLKQTTSFLNSNNKGKMPLYWILSSHLNTNIIPSLQRMSKKTTLTS